MDSDALKGSFGLHHPASFLRVPYSRAQPGPNEGCHVEARMIRAVSPRRANRASQPSQASDIAAGTFFILHRNNVVDAAIHIVAGSGESVHRTVREARSVH